MGLFERLRGVTHPVEAEYRLVACSASSGGAVYENCTMDGVVTGPGIAPTAVHHVSLLTPTAKWPQPGATLPVTVERDDPARLRIRWDAVPSTADTARRLAEEQARSQRAGTAATGGADVPAQAVGGRPVPGAVGGGLTPEESARAASGGAPALGLRLMTARLLAAHEVAVPAGMPVVPGGTWDLTLDVGEPSGHGWTAVLRIGFSSPERRRLIADVGRTLPVLADPVRHDRVAIDVARLV